MSKELPCPPLGDGTFGFTKTSYGFSIEHGAEYNAPSLGYKDFRALAEYYGTEQIDTDTFAQEGCETCDHGSWYGNHIQIHNPTKNVPTVLDGAAQ